MKKFWLSVWEDDYERYTAFCCDPKDLDFLWQLADVYVRAGWHYNVQLVEMVKEDQEDK